MQLKNENLLNWLKKIGKYNFSNMTIYIIVSICLLLDALLWWKRHIFKNIYMTLYTSFHWINLNNSTIFILITEDTMDRWQAQIKHSSCKLHHPKSWWIQFLGIFQECKVWSFRDAKIMSPMKDFNKKKFTSTC